MTDLDDLPVSGKRIARGLQLSAVFHVLLICILIALSVYSAQRVEELTRLKEQHVKEEKKEKIENAVAEQQLEQDLKEVLEELSPEATAEEIEELQQVLEEEIDKEELKENLIASMDLEHSEQERSQEEYLEKLQEEISEHLDDAVEATKDDLLEQQLLEELVYEDLPEVDNNIENALKRDDFENLAKQALADKVNELASEAKKQIDRERNESTHGKERDQKHKEKTTALKEQQQQANDRDAEKDMVVAAASKLAEQTEETLKTLKEKNPYTDEAIELVAKQAKTELEQAEAAYRQAKKNEEQARETFSKEGHKAVEQIKDSLAKHNETDGVKKSEKKIKGMAKEAAKRLDDKKRKTHDAMSKINEMHTHSNWALSNKKEDMEKNAAAVRKANKARQEHQQASDQLHKAKSAMMGKALDSHKKSLQNARHMARSFARNNDLKDSVKELNKAINAHKRQGTPRTEEQLEKLKQSVAALDEARQQFARKANALRQQSLAKTERSLNELKALSGDVDALKNLENQEVRDATIAAIKDTMMDQRINGKAEYLRENLKHGTDIEKNQRTESFRRTAKDTVSAAQSESEMASSESEASEEHAESSKALPTLTMGESLQSALAQKMELLSGAGKGDEEEKNKGEDGRLSSGLRGIEVDSKALEQTIMNRWRFRKISLEEKQRILIKNTVTSVSHAPPQLRFARPTLDANKENTRAGSADIYVGQIAKREIAKLDPNRPRKAHPKFKNTDFAAVPFCRNIPQLDGDSSDWNLERTRLSKGKDVFMQWRPDGLYVLALIRDQSGAFEKAAAEKMKSTFWEFDSMEVWFDMKNSKAEKTDQHACQQFWVCPKLPGVGRDHQLWEVVWGERGRQVLRSGPGKPHVSSSVHADQKGYNLEYFIPRALLTNLNYFRAGQVLGFLYVINSSHNPNQMQSSLSKFNPNFHYSSQPSSWGNLQLLGTDAVLNTMTASGEAAEYPSVEVSQSLGLMVDDPDSNTDIGAVNSVVVRVQNRYGFDGRQQNAEGQDLGDWEDVRLMETGKNTGIFKGWVPTTLLPSATGDQKLGVQPGDQLDVYYSDHVRRAGEYDEKMHVEVAVVSPVLTVSGERNPHQSD